MCTEAFLKTQFNTIPSWSTASFGDAADTSPVELAALGAHLDLCRGSHGHLFSLQCAAQSMHGFVAARFITTLVVIVLLIGVATLVL